jgi:hypothetical protein
MKVKWNTRCYTHYMNELQRSNKYATNCFSVANFQPIHSEEYVRSSFVVLANL